MKEIKTEGVICVDDTYGFTYYVAKIEYIEREDESYKYVFTPNYSVIELLPASIFQGIPGIDLDLRKETYERENMIPVFISERTPGENREDLWSLLEDCEMEYLNRLEWLIRTNTRYSGDKLYVCRNLGKDLHIDSIEQLGNRNAIICRKVLDAICAGSVIETKSFKIDDTNRKSYYELFMNLYRTERTYIDSLRKEGIQKSASLGNYKGRSKIKIDRMKLQEVFSEYEKGKLTGEEAADSLGISRSTFNRRYREYKECQ